MKKLFIYSMLLLVSLTASAQASNVLSIPDVSLPKGARVLPVNITNADEVAAVQFDFTLPAGITLNGTATVTERGNGHSVSIMSVGANLYRLLLFAQPTAALAGTSGTVINIPINIPLPYEPGEYPLTISNATLSNKTGASVAATVSAGTLTVTDIPMTVSATGYTGVYDKEAHGITVTVTEPEEGATIKYGTAVGEYTLTENPTYTNVGTYTVYYQVTKQYYITTTGSAQVIITKADVTCTAPVPQTLVYNEQQQALVSAGTVDGGVMQYSLDNATWSTDIPTGLNAGDYRVYYRVIGDANHNDKAAEYVDVNIAKANITYTAPTNLNPIYTGSPLTLISTGTANGGEIQYSSDGTNWSTERPKGINAGNYTVYFRIVADANHIDKAAESLTATIAKADITTYTAPDPLLGLVYTGSPLTLISAGTAEGGEMQYSLDGETWSTELPKGTNAGTYTVQYRIIGDSNHNNKTGMSVTATIAKADITTYTAPAPLVGLVYTGSPLTLISAGTAEGGEMQYSLDGETWSTELPKGTNAGNYTVQYRIIGDSNHNDKTGLSVVATIAKANVACTAPAPLVGLIYTGSPMTLISAGTTNDGVMQYSLDGETWSTELPKGTNAGNYTVHYRVVGDANHNDKTADPITATIAKANITTYTAPVGLTLIYTGEAQNLVEAGSAEGGVMEYSLDGENWSTDLPKGKEIKTYTVYYRIKGDSNHNDVAMQSVEAIIKGFPVIVPPTEGEGGATQIPGVVSFYNEEFNIKLDENSGAELYTVTEVNSTTVTAKKIDVVKAGMPFLVLNKKNVENQVVLIPAGPDDTPDDVTPAQEFKGTAVAKAFTEADMAANDFYVMMNGAFVKVNGAGTLAASKCYLQIAKDAPAGAPQRAIVFGGDTTGIDVARGSYGANDGSFYDMQGRKVQQPGKGLYIVNGKKVVIK